jgi:hypothetical protein
VAAVSAPIIMTALMGDEDFAWANRLRIAHFPPERNVVPAHITLFHHLPPGECESIAAQIKTLCRDYAPPAARLDRMLFLGRGSAYHVDSPQLHWLRALIAERLYGQLVPQDQHKPRFHITVQNKVEGHVAKALFAQLETEFAPRPLIINGLALWYYLGGPWEAIGQWRFRGSVRPG